MAKDLKQLRPGQTLEQGFNLFKRKHAPDDKLLFDKDNVYIVDSRTPGKVAKIEECAFDCFACHSHLVKDVLVTIRHGSNVCATKYFNPTNNEAMVQLEL